MFGIIFRLAWRLMVFVVGVGIAYITVRSIFPYLDRRLPLLLVVIIMYALVAYALIPGLVRLWRLVIKPNHIPVYVTTGDGWASDPVNIAVVCNSREQLIDTMSKAGWTTADKVTLTSFVRLGFSILLGKPYPTAPFSSLFLFNRRQDIGFQVQEGNPPTPRHRHHVRFWLLDQTAEDVHHSFWQKLLEHLFKSQQQIWIGAATHDIAPFAFRMRNLQVTHQIDSDTNKERDYLINTLKDADLVRGVDEITSGDPLAFRGQTFGVNIVVDGQLKIIKIKS